MKKVLGSVYALLQAVDEIIKEDEVETERLYNISDKSFWDTERQMDLEYGENWRDVDYTVH